MNPKGITLILLGSGGFPYGITAAGTKFRYLAKSLLSEENNIHLLTKFNISNDVSDANGIKDGIHYSFLAGKKKRASSFSKLVGELVSCYRLIGYLRKEKKSYSDRFLIISYAPLILIIYYWGLSRVLGYKLILSIMEYHPALYQKPIKKVQSKIFWKISIRLPSGILPISKYIMEKVNEVVPHTPQFLIPVLADFNHIGFKSITHKNKQFTYCGNIGYYEVIDLLIKAYKSLSDRSYKLILVLHGNMDKINHLKENEYSSLGIEIKTNLSDIDLYKVFTHSIGLLIPIRSNIQDIARFPQKIAEYAASGSPIITTTSGEINNYFLPDKDIICASEFSANSIAQAMQYVIENDSICRQIGINAKSKGRKYFHYESISESLLNFLTSL